MGDKELDETNFSNQCSFSDDFEKFSDNKELDPFFDGHPVKDFVFVDNNSINIECSCGKKANLTNREIYEKLYEKKEELEKSTYGVCKEGDNHKKFEYYHEELKKNLCDICLKDINENLFNFDNNLRDYSIMVQKIEEKFQKDEKDGNIIPPQIKDSFKIIKEIFKINHHDYSFFSIIKGFYNFYIGNNELEV